MPRIHVLQGANMNWLGIREPEIYGTTTAAELDQQIADYARQKGFELLDAALHLIGAKRKG